MARQPRIQRPKVDIIFFSAPDRLEVGPDDHFEVGKVYQVSPASRDRWVNLGRARDATDEEIGAMPSPVIQEPRSADDGDGVVVTELGPVEQEYGDALVVSGNAGAGPQISASETGPAEPPMGAQALIERMQGDDPLPFFSFKAEAKRLLGEGCPAKKEEIIEALRAVA